MDKLYPVWVGVQGRRVIVPARFVPARQREKGGNSGGGASVAQSLRVFRPFRVLVNQG